MKRIKTGIASAVLAAYSLMITASADLDSALQTAKQEGENTIKSVMDKFILPIMVLFCVVAFVFYVVKAIFDYRRGEAIHNDVIIAIVILIAVALLQSFATWGWSIVS